MKSVDCELVESVLSQVRVWMWIERWGFQGRGKKEGLALVSADALQDSVDTQCVRIERGINARRLGREMLPIVCQLPVAVALAKRNPDTKGDRDITAVQSLAPAEVGKLTRASATTRRKRTIGARV